MSSTPPPYRPSLPPSPPPTPPLPPPPPQPSSAPPPASSAASSSSTDACAPDSDPAAADQFSYAFPLFLLSAAAAVVVTSFLTSRRRRPPLPPPLAPRAPATPQQHKSASASTSVEDDDTAASAANDAESEPTAQSQKKPPLSPPAASALARAWIAADPDPHTCDAVSEWLAHHKLSATPATPPSQQLQAAAQSPPSPTSSPSHPSSALTANLPYALDPTVSRLRFGTAGVRAPMGPGYDRLNALTVIAVAQAVATVLPQSAADDARPVVVGHDARHNSRKFALLIAQVFRHHGRTDVHLFSSPVPTPLVAFHARAANAVAALCVTASHNPRDDNGVKVFWGDGIQIRPAVARRVEAAMPVSLKPWTKYSLDERDVTPLVQDPLAAASRDFIATLAEKLPLRTSTVNRRAPPVVYTACHGVGLRYVADLFSAFGLPSLIPCRAQCAPDPNFPTLPFPNPEEKAVLDRAIETARGYEAPLVIANDPDADRFAAAELLPDGSERIFTGNEIAALLTDYLTAQIRPDKMASHVVVTSAVSSKILASMARVRGFQFNEALPGFKWINKKAVELEESGMTVLLSYEEAIGYNITQNIVRDKCGISVAAVFAEMAASAYEKEGGTLSGRLTHIEKECGVHLSFNGYLRLTDKSPSVGAIFDAARKKGLPKRLGDVTVMSHRDMTKGIDSAEDSGESAFPADPTSQFLTFRCATESSEEDDTPLIIHLRGSGTEPKIKYYSELRCAVEQREDGSGQKMLEAAVESAIAQVLRPDVHRLTR